MALEVSAEGASNASLAGQAAPQAGSFLRNLAWTVTGFGVSMLSTIVLTPFLVRRLGLEAYGIVALVMNSTVYLTILTNVINPVAGRYFVASRHGVNGMSAGRVFSTIWLVNVAVCALVMGLVVLLTRQIGAAMGVPETQVRAFAPTLWLTGLSMVATQMGITYGFIPYSLNRLDIQSLSGIVQTLLRIAAVLSLFLLFPAHVAFVGAAMLVASVGGCIVFRQYARRALPEMRVAASDFDGALLRKMAQESFWVMLTQLGTLLFLRIDVFLAGRMYGMSTAGEYGALVALLVPIQSVAILLGGLSGPQITNLAVKKENPELAQYVGTAVKLLGFVLAIPSILLCANAELVIRRWVGLAQVSDVIHWSLVALGAHLCVTYGAIPMLNLQVAYGRMRLPSAVTWLLAGLNLAMSVLLVRYTSLGLISLPLSIAVCLIIKNGVVTPIHCALVLKRHWASLLMPVLAPAGVFVAGFMADLGMRRCMPASALMTGAAASAAGVAAAGLLALGLMAREERALAWAMVRRIQSKFVPAR